MPIKAWTVGVPFEDGAARQLKNLAALPFVHKWVAGDAGRSPGPRATVGSVVATSGAIIPAAVGVDIGCGMMALRTSLRADQLPDDLAQVRSAIEARVPHGRTDNGGRNESRRVARRARGPSQRRGRSSRPATRRSSRSTRSSVAGAMAEQLGTLGTGNHFIELCLDEEDRLWIMLHSGSRGVGNRIGSHFIQLAKREMERFFIRLPDQDLAYLPEGTAHYGEYVQAVGWAQEYAMKNRELMMENVLAALGVLRASGKLPEFTTDEVAVNCHHNYVAREHHYGKDVMVTRKGAVRAGLGDLGIIPGSMGARSFITRGLGNPESFCSSSHGAGRVMSRTEAKRRFTVEDHARATEGIECRKDADVIDETPAAYKSIEDVMRAQKDLVEIVHTLRQVVCVKG